jgi:hypothetical protein
MPEQHSGRSPELPDLATPAARATVAPPFEQIVERARRHRRHRTAVGLSIVFLAMLAAASTGVLLSAGHRDGAPQPVHPSPSTPSRSPSTAPTVRSPDAAAIVRTGGVTAYAAGPDGSLLTVWQHCETGEDGTCRSAWQLQTAAGVHRGLAHGEVTSAFAAGNSFVVNAWDKGAIVIGPTGAVRQVERVGSGTTSAGTVFVHSRKALLVVDPRSAKAWPLGSAPDGGSWTSATLSATGTTWAMAMVGDQSRISWSPDGARWQHHTMPADEPGGALPAYVAVTEDHVAAVSGYDGATVLPVADLAVTSDGGRSWTDLHQADLPFQYVDAIAATSGGTLYVTTAGGEKLYRSTDTAWTRFVEVPNPTRADSLVPAGDRVIGRGGSFTEPVLVAFDDAGRAEPVPLTR